MPPNLRRWRTPLLDGLPRIGCALLTKIIRALRFGRPQASDAEALEVVERALECSLKGHNRMQYHNCRSARATSRVLVSQRMQSSGRRWRLANGQVILNLLCTFDVWSIGCCRGKLLTTPIVRHLAYRNLLCGSRDMAGMIAHVRRGDFTRGVVLVFVHLGGTPATFAHNRLWLDSPA